MTGNYISRHFFLGLFSFCSYGETKSKNLFGVEILRGALQTHFSVHSLLGTHDSHLDWGIGGVPVFACPSVLTAMENLDKKIWGLGSFVRVGKICEHLARPTHFLLLSEFLANIWAYHCAVSSSIAPSASVWIRRASLVQRSCTVKLAFTQQESPSVTDIGGEGRV